MRNERVGGGGYGSDGAQRCGKRGKVWKQDWGDERSGVMLAGYYSQCADKY